MTESLGWYSSSGTWELIPKKNRLDFEAHIGGFATFKDGTIPEYDTILKGNVENDFFGRGFWSATHKSIFTEDTPQCDAALN